MAVTQYKHQAVQLALQMMLSKLDELAWAYSLSVWEAEEEPWIQAQPGPSHLGYRGRPCLKKTAAVWLGGQLKHTGGRI